MKCVTKYSYFRVRNCVCDNGNEIFENRVMIRTEISHIIELIWLGVLLLATLVPYPSLRKAPNDRPHRLRTAGGLALWPRARCPFYDNLPVNRIRSEPTLP